MNINIRLFQSLKAISCRISCQRGKSMEHNLLGGRIRRYEMQKQHNEISPLGYFLLGIPVASFVLGTWQIHRRQWKLALIDDLHSRVTSPATELPLDLSDLESMEYRPIKVRGRFLHENEIIAGPKSLIVNGAAASENAGAIFTPGRSNTGFCVITPFKLEDRDLTILVNRGWVPTEYKKDHKQARNNSDQIVEVTGVVRLAEKRPPFIPKNSPETGGWFFRDLDAMAKVAGTAPVYIELVAEETVQGGPIGGQTRVTLRNEHLSYIFTWYSLCAITGWMWHKQFIRKLPVM